MITQLPSICTAGEIQQITGRKRAAAQQRWLQRNGWHFVTSASGNIIVARSHMEQQLNPITHRITHNAGQDTPDWSALDATS